jgi:cysteine desulfurase/selenocysteine lyase
LDDAGVAVRAGHHCAQPLMRWLRVEATARASFAAHSDSADIAALVTGIEQVKRVFRK